MSLRLASWERHSLAWRGDWPFPNAHLRNSTQINEFNHHQPLETVCFVLRPTNKSMKHTVILTPSTYATSTLGLGRPRTRPLRAWRRRRCSQGLMTLLIFGVSKFMGLLETREHTFNPR
eukprot:1344041-Amorphochlora_amoeboformis.AAC.2